MERCEYRAYQKVEDVVRLSKARIYTNIEMEAMAHLCNPSDILSAGKKKFAVSTTCAIEEVKRLAFRLTTASASTSLAKLAGDRR